MWQRRVCSGRAHRGIHCRAATDRGASRQGRGETAALGSVPLVGTGPYGAAWPWALPWSAGGTEGGQLLLSPFPWLHALRCSTFLESHGPHWLCQVGTWHCRKRPAAPHERHRAQAGRVACRESPAVTDPPCSLFTPDTRAETHAARGQPRQPASGAQTRGHCHRQGACGLRVQRRRIRNAWAQHAQRGTDIA